MVRFTQAKRKAYRRTYYVNNHMKAIRNQKKNYEANVKRRKDTDKAWYQLNSKKVLHKRYKQYLLHCEQKKTSERERYQSDPNKKRAAKRERYQSDPNKKKVSERERYHSDPNKKRAAKRERYQSDPNKKKVSERERYHSDPNKKRAAKRETYQSDPNKKKVSERERYQSDPNKKKVSERERYQSDPNKKRAYERERYQSDPNKKRATARERYDTQPEKKRKLVQARYRSLSTQIKQAMRNRYSSNPILKQQASRIQYAKNLLNRKYTMRRRYIKCRSEVLFKKRCAYYGYALSSRRTAMLYQAYKCILTARMFLCNQRNKEKRTNHYNLHEPTVETKELSAQKMKRHICTNVPLKHKIIQAFRTSRKCLVECTKSCKLANAVLNICVRKVLNILLQQRKHNVGKFLACIKAINAMEISDNNLGEQYHTASSEPFFYDQSYCLVKYTSPIAVDSSGRCVVAEEIGDRDPKTNQPLKWKCTSECKLPILRERKCITNVKLLFQQCIPKLRQKLTHIDSCTQHGHYSIPLDSANECSGLLYRDLAGHPLPCAYSGCDSSLRTLRSIAPHFPKLRKFVCVLYEAIAYHKTIDSIDMALSTGDYENACTLCSISDHKMLFTRSVSSTNSTALIDVHECSLSLQQPKLPDLESHLHIEYAEVIAQLEKRLSDDAEFPCASCERLLQRKQVTAFKFSAKKFSSDVWKALKSYILASNSDAVIQTHYVCQYCRPILNNNKMPCRCVLNGLQTEPLPKELQNLDPLSKQLIQRAKSFQAVYRLGTYTGKVPSHNSLKACKGTMFFLPLPLEKTLETLKEVENKMDCFPSKLPDPELFIIVNSKPTKNRIIWQSLINVDQLKAALKKLKDINWLYADIDESSLDEASKRIIESVSDTTSTMLQKISVDEISSYQSYTIRRLDQQQSKMPDSEQYKLMNVKEDALSNKLKYLDVLCFPTLFPSGRFGESHPRKVPITPSEFAKSHLLNKDGRFRKDDLYVFYLLWQKEMRDLGAGIYNLLKGTRQQAMPVQDFLGQLSKSNQDVEANLSTVFQSIRGSKQYWFHRKSEVLCMVREYGSPTLFLTLSCAEYDSIEISTYLRKVNNVSDNYPLAKLCIEDPISVSRKFSQKFHDFFDTVILKGQALGPVGHYFYKKEYQTRGAPHYHILLWIDGAPVAGKDDDGIVLRWIQERITCRIPEEKSNPQLHQLVTKYQYHKCNNYCQRRKCVKGTFITRCRFGFPRQPCESATLLSVDDCMKLSHRKMYELPRSPHEIRINNYNPLLLMLWKANMDLQFVGESSLAIAHYVTGYVTNAEKSNMQDLWQEVSSHSSVYSKLWSFGIRSLRSRECGLYEASDLLLGDHLCGKSKTIKWIDVSQPQTRKRRLLNHSQLVRMSEINPNSTNIFENNLIDTFYPQRPKDMQDVCLYDFVADYVKSGVDKHGKLVYRKLGKSILPNHKLYNPNRENERESYFYSLLLLFIPFRNEGDLINDGEKAENAFNRHMKENNALKTHSEKLCKMLKAHDTVQKINEARQANAETVKENEPLEEDEGLQVVGEARSAMSDIFDLHQHGDSPSLEHLVSSLNTDQTRIFKHVQQHLEHQACHESLKCTCSDLRPLRMFLSGVGGTGKSFLIKTIQALVAQIWKNNADSPLCAVTAPTGLAAFNVGGVTIHRLLQLPIEHEGKTTGYWRLGNDALKVMRTSLSQLRLLIIDEVSMVSNINLAYIHLRLDEIYAKDQWFGGLNVLFVGDILQLPPVNGASVFERINNKSVASKLGCMTTINIWQDTVMYDELTINERQKEDQLFSSMLNEVRCGCPSQKTIQALQARVITIPVVDKFHELLASKESPLCLFPTRKSCHEFNLQMLSKLETETRDIMCTDEVDETTGIFRWSKKATEEMKKLNTDCNLTAGLEAVLRIAIGARVMLRRNIDTSIGLVNGALGTVISIKAHHIGVKFDNIQNVYQVPKVKSRFMVMNKIYVRRMQFPLILAFAVTIHKCQGLSLNCAIMDLSDQVFCAGMAYVALSRVKKLEKLHLISFQPQVIKASPMSLQEINRLRQIYRPDLPQYTVQHTKLRAQKRKRKLTGSLLSHLPNKKGPKLVGKKRKTSIKNAVKPPYPKRQKVHVSNEKREIHTVSQSHMKKPYTKSVDKQFSPPSNEKCNSSPDLVCVSAVQSQVPRWYQVGKYNPLTEELQHQLCERLGLRFVCANRCTPGGPNVPLRYPTHVHQIQADGNCLFRALCYVITGSQRQHFKLRSIILTHLRTTDACRNLLGGYITNTTIQQYIAHSCMDQNGVWGTQNEMLVLAHMAEINIVSFNTHERRYNFCFPGVIDYNAYPEDDTRPSIYLEYTGNHFNVVLAQD